MIKYLDPICFLYKFLIFMQIIIASRIKNDGIKYIERKNEDCLKYISRISDNENWVKQSFTISLPVKLNKWSKINMKRKMVGRN